MEYSNGQCNVQHFALLQESNFWFNLTAVQVDFIWRNDRENKLYLFLIDQNRDKMVAIVPQHLMHLYNDNNLVGRVFSLDHFKIDWPDYQYPRYRGYSFVRCEWNIIISNNTMLNPLFGDIETSFPHYPWVHSIRSLTEDRTTRRMLVDVVGRKISGYRGNHVWMLELQDVTGHTIVIDMHDIQNIHYLTVRRGIRDKAIIYVARAKLVHLDLSNMLRTTDVTTVVFEPNLPEANAIRNMQI